MIPTKIVMLMMMSVRVYVLVVGTMLVGIFSNDLQHNKHIQLETCQLFCFPKLTYEGVEYFEPMSLCEQ